MDIFIAVYSVKKGR